MSLQTRLTSLAQAVGADIKQLRADVNAVVAGSSGVLVSTHANRPAPATVGALCFVTDLTAPYKLQVSDGTNWLAASDGTIVASYVPASTALTYVSSGDTNGLIYYLGTRGGSFATPVPQTAGTSGTTLTGAELTIVVSSILAAGYEAWMAVDRLTTNGFCSDGTSGGALGATYRLDLKTRKLIPNKLTIASPGQLATDRLIGFVLEGSNDAAAWTTLLTVPNAGYTATAQWKAWDVTGSVAYRYLRVRLTALDSSGYSCLAIGEIELYGTLS